MGEEEKKGMKRRKREERERIKRRGVWGGMLGNGKVGEEVEGRGGRGGERRGKVEMRLGGRMREGNGGG